jgi:hypothetical protein
MKSSVAETVASGQEVSTETLDPSYKNGQNRSTQERSLNTTAPTRNIRENDLGKEGRAHGKMPLGGFCSNGHAPPDVMQKITLIKFARYGQSSSNPLCVIDTIAIRHKKELQLENTGLAWRTPNSASSEAADRVP